VNSFFDRLESQLHTAAQAQTAGWWTRLRVRRGWLRTPMRVVPILASLAITVAVVVFAIGIRAHHVGSSVGSRGAPGMTWSLGSLATPRPTNWSLSCSSPSTCTAVGTAFTGHTPSGLIERWNGRRWMVQSRYHSHESLSGVSCATNTVCTAVGATGENRTAALVERWSGGRWLVQPSPTLPEPSGLNQVSCPTVNMCVAVGQTANGRPYIATWNGQRWSISNWRQPTGTGDLVDVSCASASVCVAVGQAQGRTPTGWPGPWPLAVTWNGREWATQKPPNYLAPGAGQPMFYSVSCASVSFCVVVGGGGRNGWLQAWDGRTWTRQRAHAPGWTAFGVSCPSAHACIAISNNSPQSSQTLFEVDRWNAQGWTGVQRIRVPTATGWFGGYVPGSLALACPSRHTCIVPASWFGPRPYSRAVYLHF
jgi:hypothetical protein